MSDNDRPDEELWVVPLHGAVVPVPPTADGPPAGGRTPPVSDGANAEPIFGLFPGPDESPTDG